jgi:hypothetical protein
LNRITDLFNTYKIGQKRNYLHKVVFLYLIAKKAAATRDKVRKERRGGFI